MPPAGHAAAMRNLKALGDSFFAASDDATTPSATSSAAASYSAEAPAVLSKAAQRVRDDVAIRVPQSIRAAQAAALGVDLSSYNSTLSNDPLDSSVVEPRASLAAARASAAQLASKINTELTPGSIEWREAVRALLRCEAHLANVKARCVSAARHLAGNLPRGHQAAAIAARGVLARGSSVASGAANGSVGVAGESSAGGANGQSQQGSSADGEGGAASTAKRKRADESGVSGVPSGAGSEAEPAAGVGAMSASSAAPSSSSTSQTQAGEAAPPLPKRARTGTSGGHLGSGIVSVRTNASTLAVPLQKGTIVAARLGDLKKRRGAGRGGARRGRAADAASEADAGGDAEDECEWIIGSVVRFLSSGDYEIEDVDADADALAAAARGGTSTTSASAGTRKRHTLAPRNIVQLPAFPRNNVKLAAGWYEEIPVGTDVWAVFPHTTSFYPGVVTGLPSKNEENPNAYRVRFQDDEDEYGGTPDRNVHAQYVFASR